MKRRLPPLNALRAFEAAARHVSFVAAAEELAVTPAAISHQIKALEENLGVALFVRRHRAVELTAAGKRLLPGLAEAFDGMVKVVDEVRPRAGGPITISASPSFAAKWLAPRLERFLSEYPDAAVRVQAESRVVDLAAEEVDLAVRFSIAGKVVSEPLFEDWVFPVCNSVLRMALKAPANLTMQTLLYDDLFEQMGGGGAVWASWLAHVGVADLKPARAQHFSHTTLALDAAARGQGVALGRGSLVWQELRAATLVRPFDTAVPAGRQYHVVRAADRPLSAEGQQFLDWLVAEAAVFRNENPKLVR